MVHYREIFVFYLLWSIAETKEQSNIILHYISLHNITLHQVIAIVVSFTFALMIHGHQVSVIIININIILIIVIINIINTLVTGHTALSAS